MKDKFIVEYKEIKPSNILPVYSSSPRKIKKAFKLYFLPKEPSKSDQYARSWKP